MDRILHFIWIDNGNYEFRYHHAFSMISAVKYLKPDQIIFWTNEDSRIEKSELFKKVVNIFEHDGILEKFEFMIKKSLKTSIRISSEVIKNPSHVADWYKIQILKEHGGCYSDLDNIFVKDHQKYWDLDKYSAPLEHNYQTGVPEAFCANLIFSPKNHPFLTQWEKGYNFYLPNHYYFNAITIPFEIQEMWRFNEDPLYETLNPVSGPSWSGNHWDGFDLYKLYAADHLDSDFREVEVFHLWESHAKRWLEKQDLEYLKSVNTTYTRLVKEYIKVLDL